MITEDYVSFEVAKLLKEKGFKGIGSFFYDKEGTFVDFNNYWRNLTPTERYKAIEAPTHQMVLKWLREKYHLEVGITVGFPTIKNITKYKYFWYIVKVCDNHLEYPMDDPNSSEFCEEMTDSYEQAIEAAIKYCLTNLIK